MGNKILNFKMWEDAAANSAGGGGVDGIGVGSKGEPGVKLKKKKKKEKEISFSSTTEKSRIQHNTSPGGDWEQRSSLQRGARSQMWKDLGKKLKRK